MIYVLWKIVRGQPEFDRSLGNETHAVIPAVYVHMCLVVGSWSVLPHMQLQAATPEYLEQMDRIVLKIQGMEISKRLRDGTRRAFFSMILSPV